VLGTTDANNHEFLEYRLDTKRAPHRGPRSAGPGEPAAPTWSSQASNDANTDPLIGRTLFNLLVPLEVEPFLAGTTGDGDRARQEHGGDSLGTAGLEPGRSDRGPPAVGDPQPV